jgi:hypothetical protein
MTGEQEKHLRLIQNQLALLVDNKYRNGQKEHGGNLFDMDPNRLLDEAIGEAIDQVVYLLTLKSKFISNRT